MLVLSDNIGVNFRILDPYQIVDKRKQVPLLQPIPFKRQKIGINFEFDQTCVRWYLRGCFFALALCEIL